MTLGSTRWRVLHGRPGLVALFLLAALAVLVVAPTDALAHGVTAGDKGFIQESSGILLVPFAYLGAKLTVARRVLRRHDGCRNRAHIGRTCES